MEWNEVALDSYRAAQELRKVRPRSCVSRAYYSAHAALTRALLRVGYQPPQRHQTPPHQQMARLIGEHLASLGPGKVRELRSSIRRLYAARLEADYVNTASIDGAIALGSVRDAASVLRALEVRHDDGH
jgi:uncharacterized protein (UPF0332 family)